MSSPDERRVLSDAVIWSLAPLAGALLAATLALVALANAEAVPARADRSAIEALP